MAGIIIKLGFAKFWRAISQYRPPISNGISQDDVFKSILRNSIRAESPLQRNRYHQILQSRVKKHSFSLIELMIALIIVAVTTGTSYMMFKRGYDERQAKNVVELIEQKLRTASLLARLTQGQVDVIIEEKSPVSIFLSTDIKIAGKLKPLFHKKEPLGKVTTVECVPQGPQKVDDTLKIAVFPWGINYPQSTLEVHFTTGVTSSLKLEKYTSDVSIVPSEKIATIFPEEVLEHAENKKVVQSS